MKKKSIFAPFTGWKYLFRKPVTLPMDDIFKNPRESQDNYRGFHVNDWTKCIGCGTCSEVCPTKAITMAKRADVPDVEGSLPERPVIDYGRCCFCGLCVDICTSGSLSMSKGYLYNSSDPEAFIYMPTDQDITGKAIKTGYVKDDNSDLLDLDRTSMTEVSADERKQSFIEIVRGYSCTQAKAEAARCVACGICTKTCPVHMNIPEYIESVWKGDLKEGLDYLYKTNPLPSVCGRICTHKCESACSISQRGDAIAIRWLKRYIVDNAPDDAYESVVGAPVSKPGEGKVAIIGSGSAGLSAAYYLSTLGYPVDVYEKRPQVGGPMRYGAPRYRLPDSALDHDLKLFGKLGVRFITGTEVGKDIAFDDLRTQYDVVFMATGYPATRRLRIEGEEHPDVILAMEFLAAVTDYQRGLAPMPDIQDNVTVIGSGNVAFDVARSLVRLQNEKFGKANVKMMALEQRDQIPADIEEVIEGEEEGIQFNLGYGPQKIEINQETGLIKAIQGCVCTRLFDENKRFSPEFDFNKKISIESKQVYLAVGQTSDLSYLPEAMMQQIKMNRGKIQVSEYNQVMGFPWLFAGGDLIRGMDIINGIADGHQAAIGIDKYLSEKRQDAP
ncbi:MAG: FAD-dependent oxidoreductase [Bacillota bacterium]|nr:FAD-dependent oxidoreductase [Bacillota bacterium]